MLLCTSRATHRATILGYPSIRHQIESCLTYTFSFRDDHIAAEVRWFSVGAVLESLEKARTDLELKIAGEVQDALLPRTCHAGDYFEAVGASLACRMIGGDFFEYVDLPSGDFGFALGDVAGKGVSAALLASMVQGILATEAVSGCGPAAVVSHVNGALFRRQVESRFATAFYALLSRTGRLTYCNAGHNPSLIVGKCGVRRLETGGLILGAFKDATFEEETVQLDPDDVLVVFSDGVTEAMNVDDVEFGEERLLASITAHREFPPTALLERILAAVHEFSTGAEQSDDVTAMVLRYTGSA